MRASRRPSPVARLPGSDATTEGEEEVAEEEKELPPSLHTTTTLYSPPRVSSSTTYWPRKPDPPRTRTAGGILELGG
jgi:hypothetical protein